MTYDNYGNILTKNGKTYTYGNSTWKDLLTAYNGQTITYDAQGNPVEYLGNILTWEKGRQLKSFCENSYTYNANGIRTSKTVGSVKHTYTLDGAKILKEVWGENTLIPMYDSEESVCGIIYNGTPYYFLKNLQGDIIGITNASGTAIARYNYDAWGVCTSAYDTSGCNIAAINPYRYRSYYYDDEIHMYYLQSRYYDPVVGRFINADDPEIIDNASDYSILSCNKYCYCLNSPVKNSDVYGSMIKFIADMICNFFWGMVGGMLGLYLANVTLNVVNGKKKFYAKNDSWGQYISEGVKAGAFAIFGNKIVWKIVAVVGASVLKQIIDCFFSKKGFNLWGLLTDIFVGVLMVIAIHFTPTILNKLPKSKQSNSNKIIEKIKPIIKKVADYIMKTLKGTIDKVIKFFKNVFVKRFSISYAKRIGSELKKLFL